jgi:predicted nucleic acid-binding Zn ribbon protein
MHSFLEILRKLQSKNPLLKQRIDEAGALSRWEKAVGAQIAKHTRAIQVKDSVLWVEVDHPIWKSELHHRKRQILAALNRPALPDTGTTPAQSPQKPTQPPEIIKDLLLLDPRGR